jgi:hypothetical protein
MQYNDITQSAEPSAYHGHEYHIPKPSLKPANPLQRFPQAYDKLGNLHKSTKLACSRQLFGFNDHSTNNKLKTLEKDLLWESEGMRPEGSFLPCLRSSILYKGAMVDPPALGRVR